jgi:RimJ/RimL family protein N-acetyltransferase
MPAGLARPRPPLADDVIRLEQLDERFIPDFEQLATDPDVRRFTRVPVEPDAGFAAAWVNRYVSGWADGSRAGFAIVSGEGEFLGLAALVDLDLPARQGEIGYIVKPSARGRGVAGRALGLVAQWALGPFGLARVELRISTGNEASQRVAERLGFAREGVLRSVHLKDDVREDVAVYSLLRGELPAE